MLHLTTGAGAAVLLELAGSSAAALTSAGGPAADHGKPDRRKVHPF